MSDFVARHKPEWDELERLLKRARRWSGRLTADEIARLDVLYRRVTIALAQVASRTQDRELTLYLNSLAASAHSIIYLPPRRSVLKGAWQFLLNGFPEAVASSWKLHALSGALLVLGALVAYFSVLQDPLAAYAILPASEIRVPGASHELLLDMLRYGRDQGHGSKFAFASFLFSNNTKVALLAMATGALAAVPTILLMLYNGMMLGAMTATYHGQSIYAEYWAWILPHGVTELLAIVLCGGIGLRLGQALVHPGMRTRGESMRLAGAEAVRVCAGCIAMLVFAAVIESYLRQSHLPTPARLGFAGATAVFWAGYLARGMRALRTT